MSTLKFAHRAKSVRNTAHVNEDADQRTLLRKYEAELRKLRAELQMRQREVVDKRHLLAVSPTAMFCQQCKGLESCYTSLRYQVTHPICSESFISLEDVISGGA